MKRILLLLLMLALVPCFGHAAAEEAGILGKPFPEFTATDTEGMCSRFPSSLRITKRC